MKDISSELNKQMMEIIEKDLPNQIGVKLKQVLEQAKDGQERIAALKEESEKYEKEILRYHDSIQELQSEINVWKTKEERYVNLERDKRMIEEKERNFKLQLIELELRLEKELRLDYRNILEVVFKSPIYKKEINSTSNKQIPYQDQNGYSNTHCACDNETKTIIESEE